MNKQNTFLSRRPLLGSIVIVLGLLATLFLAGMSSVILKIDNKWTFLFAFVVVGIVLTVFLLKNGNLQFYGFKPKKSHHNYILIAPLFLIAISPLVNGFNSQLNTGYYIYIIVFMTVVAFVEEVIYRGIILNALKARGVKYAIIGSAVLFGISHILTATGGASVEDVILQVLFAFVIGMILAVIMIRTNNIYICISYHFINNVITKTSLSAGANDKLISYIILSISVIYLIFLNTSTFKKLANSNA